MLATWATTFGVLEWILILKRSWALLEASFRSLRSFSSAVSDAPLSGTAR